MTDVLGHDLAFVRLYWTEDNLGLWDELCCEICPWCRIVLDLLTSSPELYHCTIDVPRFEVKIIEYHYRDETHIITIQYGSQLTTYMMWPIWSDFRYLLWSGSRCTINWLLEWSDYLGLHNFIALHMPFSNNHAKKFRKNRETVRHTEVIT